MTESDSSQQQPDSELQQRWMEALLRAVYQTEKEPHSLRVGQLMERVRQEVASPEVGGQQGHSQPGIGADVLESTPTSVPVNASTGIAGGIAGQATMAGAGSRRWGWMLATCAALLLLFVLPVLPFWSQPSAVATVERTLRVSQLDIPRHYQLQVDFLMESGNQRWIEGDLYVKGSDHLAVRIPAILVPHLNAWAGHNDEEAWVVPALGPVMVGDQLALGKWLGSQSELSTPYLHVSSLLSRMLDAYDLKTVSDSQLPANVELPEALATANLQFDHIKASRLRNRERLPAEIEVWIERETGVVYRLEANWERDQVKRGRRRIVLQWLSDEELPEDWFKHETHHAARRRVITMDAAVGQGASRWLEGN